MHTNEDATLSSSLVLARTGTIKGVPAMIAFDGSKRTLLLVQKGAEWVQEREVQYGGIRGMGLLTKYLDEGSARLADKTPIFEEGKAAPEAKAPKAAPAPKASPVTLADVNPAPEARAAMDKVVGVKRTRKAKSPATPAAPKAEPPVAPPAPVGPVLDPAIVHHLGHDRAVEVATTTDLAVLRKTREAAITAGAPAEVVRAITLRAGEIACGFTLAGVKKAPVAKEATEKAPRAEQTASTRQTPTKKIGIREMIDAGIVKAGDEIHLRGKPEIKTTLTADGHTATGASLGQWGKEQTGWPSMNVYANLVHTKSGKLLGDLRPV
jgi:hypothetical protein